MSADRNKNPVVGESQASLQAASADEPLVRASWRPFLTALVALITIVSFLLMLAALPFHFALVQMSCLGPACEDNATLLSAASAAVLSSYGISIRAYAAYQSFVGFLTFTLGAVLSLLILWQRPGSRIALLVALALGTGGLAVNLFEGLIVNFPQVALPIRLFQYIGNVTIITIFFVFPDGRFIPSWIRWWAAVFLINEFIYVFFSTAPFQEYVAYQALEGTIWILTFAVIVAVQVYRYRTVSGPVARTQTKWVIYGLAVAISSLLLLLGGAWFFGLDKSPVYELLFAAASPVLFSILPLTLGIAILRYRLFDIELIVRRTLAYAGLTALLVSLYFSCVVLLQRLFVAASGQQSPISIVLSTLLIAALFAPLRGRIQGFIDRRFFRRKYDAQQVLASFAQTARDETDLENLSTELLKVVNETMQPESISLWITPS
jgi:hypothetical protein